MKIELYKANEQGDPWLLLKAETEADWDMLKAFDAACVERHVAALLNPYDRNMRMPVVKDEYQ